MIPWFTFVAAPNIFIFINGSLHMQLIATVDLLQPKWKGTLCVVLGNGTIAPFSRQLTWCCRIAPWSYLRCTGSKQCHWSVAKASDNKPQQLASACLWTFSLMKVTLEPEYINIQQACSTVIELGFFDTRYQRFWLCQCQVVLKSYKGTPSDTQYSESVWTQMLQAQQANLLLDHEGHLHKVNLSLEAAVLQGFLTQLGSGSFSRCWFCFPGKFIARIIRTAVFNFDPWTRIRIIVVNNKRIGCARRDTA